MSSNTRGPGTGKYDLELTRAGNVDGAVVLGAVDGKWINSLQMPRERKHGSLRECGVPSCWTMSSENSAHKLGRAVQEQGDSDTLACLPSISPHHASLWSWQDWAEAGSPKSILTGLCFLSRPRPHKTMAAFPFGLIGTGRREGWKTVLTQRQLPLPVTGCVYMCS